MAGAPAAPRPLGILSRGQGGSEEWPAAGAAGAVAANPLFGSKAALQPQVEAFGLQRPYSTLLAEARDDPRGTSRGKQLSHAQSRAWADRRVREGISRARSGDQKGAVERYDAALELCPRHKEGLVARGAALVNVGRLSDALRDFDAALVLDPGDANATKYRDIARKRLREEGPAEQPGAGAVRSEKRRRGGAAAAFPPLAAKKDDLPARRA
uniref:Uncharacterized protein n=1 Tax=Alexandrium catenella TaxID=2925 RepID=A0A7S1RWW3_ALECA